MPQCAQRNRGRPRVWGGCSAPHAVHHCAYTIAFLLPPGPVENSALLLAKDLIVPLWEDNPHQLPLLPLGAQSEHDYHC